MIKVNAYKMTKGGFLVIASFEQNGETVIFDWEEGLSKEEVMKQVKDRVFKLAEDVK